MFLNLNINKRNFDIQHRYLSGSILNRAPFSWVTASAHPFTSADGWSNVFYDRRGNVFVFLCCSIFFFLVSWGRLRLSPLGTSATNWPIVPAPDDRLWICSSRWNENWHRKPKYSEKTCPSATLSTTNPTWLDLGSNRAAAVGSGLLTAWTMAWPFVAVTSGTETVVSGFPILTV
jgi:hypothetical protein